MKVANVEALIKFIQLRHSVYARKATGAPTPWTDDKVLQMYSFCNVYRELDRGTVWVAENWRKPHEEDPDLWFAMLVARLVNWPDTLAEVGYPVPWRARKFEAAISARKVRGAKVYSNAYLVTTAGVKLDRLTYNVARFGLLWAQRKVIRPRTGAPLVEFAETLMREARGIGKFLAGQVVADLKYATPYLNVPDWDTFALSGPGSRRGLNRVLGRELNAPWKEEDWKRQLLNLRAEVNPAITPMSPLHAQDLQNCLCEFDKYRRVSEGVVRARLRLYAGQGE